MPHNPPPAPDWIMGDDGHWKPPPFTIGHDEPMRPPPGTPLPPATAYGPPPGPGAPSGGMPLAMATPMARPVRSTATIIGLVVGGLGLAFVALIGVSVLAVTFLGTSSEGKFEAVDMDPNTPGVQNGGAPGTDPYAPLDPDGGYGPGSEDPGVAVGTAADPDVFCPTSAEVADAIGEPASSTAPDRDDPALLLNGVGLTTTGCYFGSTVSVLVVTGQDDDVMDAISTSASGDLVVSDGARDIPSIDVVHPSAGPEGGAVTALFEVGDEVYVVAHNGQDPAPVDALVELVRARVE